MIGYGRAHMSPIWRCCLETGAVLLFIVGLLSTLVGCTPQTSSVQVPEHGTSASAPSPRRAEELLIVDCLLPGQIRKLGRMTYQTPRRPIKTSAQDCEIRGGEYVAYDRADYRTALNVWLPQAQAGDKDAQTYVGEIYEKGLGLSPDYAVAAVWYRKAAEQGHARAQINLGHLYEKGLGVQPDPAQALHWYRQASGLQEAITLDPANIKWDGAETKALGELQELRQEVERWKRESAALRQQLGHTQQQLEQTRQALEQRQREANTEQLQLERARQEVEQRKQQATAAARDDMEIKRLEAQLQQREADLARQQQELLRLQQEKTQLENETAHQRTQLADLEQHRQQAALAGPLIEMVDPPLVGETRGITVVKVSSGIIGQPKDIVGKVISPTGVLTFTVNDRAEKLDNHGLFHVPVMVQGPSVPIKVVAVDRQGKRASVEFQLTADTVVSPAPPARKARLNMDFGVYYALIIGNNAYTHGWPNLKTPENDARKTAEILSTQYGFKTKVLLNATRFDILQALNEFRKTLTDKDNLLIYYAGHGHWEKKIQRGYWVPVDGDIESDVNWISTIAITDILSAMTARHVLVVADSCYSGALTRSAIAQLEPGLSDDARQHWLKTIAEKQSRTVLSSGGLQPVLDSGAGNHSVFAKAFLEALAKNTEILEGKLLGLEIAAKVSYAASPELDQEPQYAPIRFAGHEAGDFLFVPTVLQ
ncbi:MAG: peptidase C14 caspase catalytic subunit p20 [Acidobacteria bacterium]|nr:MAG: peptidase C14 caspase catalytic subunit p20 [Acidobacteriota bacterium]